MTNTPKPTSFREKVEDIFFDVQDYQISDGQSGCSIREATNRIIEAAVECVDSAVIENMWVGEVELAKDEIRKALRGGKV